MRKDESTSLKKLPTGVQIDQTPAVPSNTRETQYLDNYSFKLLHKQVLDLSSCLSGTEYNLQDRALVIEFMCEKLVYDIENAVPCLCKAVLLMDAYLKFGSSTKRPPELELIGMATLHLTMKYEGYNCKEYSNRTEALLYGFKFTNTDLMDAEMAILEDLGFSIKYPSLYDLLAELLISHFNGPRVIYAELIKISSWILIWCMIDVDFNNQRGSRLVTCIIKYAVEFYCQADSPDSGNSFLSTSIISDDFIDKFIEEPLKTSLNDKIYCLSTLNEVRAHIESFETQFEYCKFAMLLKRSDGG